MLESLRTLIVDDEPLAIERLQILCARIPRVSLVGTAMEGKSALRLIESLAPNLILLDIQMPGVDGIAIAQALVGKSPRPALIFVTAFDAFAVTAFDVAAVDYLLKPVSAERFERAIARIDGFGGPAASSSPMTSPLWTREFWVPHRSEIIRVSAKDIDLIEAERDYMRLHVGPRSFLLHETISGLERKLDPAEFVRLHRSTLVRRDRIASFRHNGSGTWEAQLHGGAGCGLAAPILPTPEAWSTTQNRAIRTR
jgi:two-component system response regulator AlgR